ncbi:MAG: hypothetical protein VCD50_13415 [Alphaproteobacteria bacterium]
MPTTDEYYFTVRVSRDYRHEVTCPICGEGFQAQFLDVHDVHNDPICNLCSWEKAPNLAGLLAMSAAVEEYSVGYKRVPRQILEKLMQRNNDPERLTKELTAALHSLGAFDRDDNDAPSQSPLASVVVNEINRALENGSVESMKFAKRLLDECPECPGQLTDDIPF